VALPSSPADLLFAVIPVGGVAGKIIKKVNLPSWAKIVVNMEHIAERRTEGGASTAGRTIFPGTIGEREVMGAIRDAYDSATKVRVQGDE
jgi:hypothetical protein